MIQIVILFSFALLIRLYGIWWDMGLHFHPDERMLIMVTDKISSWSNLNPHFFNYGSLPIYLLRIFSQLSSQATYSNMLLVGRLLSVSFDILTVFVIYKISQKLFADRKISYLAVFCYSVMFFPIQNSHFFVVDVLLTLLTTTVLYRIIIYQKTRNAKNLFLIGAFLGLSIATKFTAIVFLPLILTILVVLNLKNRRLLPAVISPVLVLIVSTFFFFFIGMPYAVLDWKNFLKDVLIQIQMNSNPYIFPYTLQYVGTLPYWYYLKSIVVFGIGPFATLLSLTGIYFITKKLKTYWIVILFYLFYFLVIGRSEVKFMRYMLPLYPFFAISAGYGLYLFKKRAIVGLFCLLMFTYTLMFLAIYHRQHTRLTATDWIINNVPNNSVIATEHWDDRLPAVGQENYQFLELTLYDQPDDKYKWQILFKKLFLSDYLVIASNRLYTPIQKLSDCARFKVCYPNASEYYRKLFRGDEIIPGYRFKKIREFTSYPTINILGISWQFPDDQADESFTVYDHPKVMIFKKERL